MKVSRRALLAQSAVVGVVSAACAPGIGQSPPKALPPASLSAAIRGAGNPVDLQFAQDFVTAHPGVQVKFDSLGTPDFNAQIEKVKAIAAAGSSSDLFVHFDCAQIAPIVGRGGILEPLDAYIARDTTVNIKEIEPEVQLQYHVAGKTYGIARGIALSTLFYNRDLFAAAGIPAPSTEWGHTSWQMDAVIEQARRLTKRDGDGKLQVAGLALRAPQGVQDVPGVWLLSNGGGLLDDLERPTQCLLERRESLDVLQMMVDLGPKRQVAPTSADLQGQSTQQWFTQGRVALYLGAAWEVADIRKAAPTFSWDAAPQPYWKKPAVVLGGSGNAMSAGSTAKDAAWALVKHLASAELQIARMPLGSDAPTRSSVLNGPEYLKDTPPVSRRVMAESVNYGRALNVRTEYATEILAAWAPAPLMNGQVAPAAYAADVAQKVKPYLQK
jgi:multiple sugar transport system substrate-binding protein